MLVGSEICLSIGEQPANRASATAKGMAAQTGLVRLRERIQAYEILLSQVVREAEDCRDQGRWCKAAHLEREAIFYESQIAIFVDALNKVQADEDLHAIAGSLDPEPFVAIRTRLEP